MDTNTSVEITIGGTLLKLTTGRMARQANGAVEVRYGNTIVLVTAVASADPRPDVDFLPLTCDYLEKTSAAGKVPGGFFKREGRPSAKEILTCRFIDRPIRPLFPDGYAYESQIIATVISADLEHDPDVLGICGAGAALAVSDIPFPEPIAGVRVGRVDGQLVCNPTYEQRKESDLEIIVAGKKDAIVMVEGGAVEVPEEEILEALLFGHEEVKKIVAICEELREKAGRPKFEFSPVETDEALAVRVVEFAESGMREALAVRTKIERRSAVRKVRKDLLAHLGEDFKEREREVRAHLGVIEKKIIREGITKDRRRVDGRGLEDIREIRCEVGLLPRAHGSALFTRGETQALVAATLGTEEDEQLIDALIDKSYKDFMLHYNFPPFCVGEAKFLRGPTRREIGHGVLAEKAIAPMLPDKEAFPYTIRIVSEILESNGSSSMATVCGGALALMDAGVPIKAPVAGIAMGLVKEGEEFFVLSDILGDEDHVGDMDFKVAGTAKGVTSIQMDIKLAGITREILKAALEQARSGRQHVLEVMLGTISQPREDISPHAPRITTIQINPKRIRDVIGPGGRIIRSIVEKTGAKIDVEDSGKINIASTNPEKAQEAIEIIRGLTADAEIGKLYMGKVRKVTDFGAFVEILPNIEGLVHISQLADRRVREVTDVVKEGEEVLVKCIDIDPSGKVRLSRKAALEEGEASGSPSGDQPV